MFTKLRLIGASGAVLVATLAGGTAAGATAEDATADDRSEVPARLERACLRIPNLTLRTDRVIERINGDAETRGSLLWLDERIARADENGRDQLVEVLENRRNVREAAVAVFELRSDELDDLGERCRRAGVDL